MAGLRWYAHDLAAYEKKTRGLTMLQHGGYRLLLDHYYSSGEPLPLDVNEVFRICRAFAEQEQSTCLFLLSKFFVEGDDGWHHLRADEELIKAATISQARAIAGKKGGKQKLSKSKALAKQKPIQSTSIDTSSLRSDVSSKTGRAPSARRGVEKYTPSETEQAWAFKQWAQLGREDLSASVCEQVEQFRDHHRGHGTTAADWPATWRTWVRNAPKFTPAPRKAPNGSAFPQAKILSILEPKDGAG